MRVEFRLLAVLFAGGLMVTACSKSTTTTGGGGGDSAGGGGTITVGGEIANDHGTKDVAGQSATQLELDDFYFSPTVLKGTPGDKLSIDLKNESGTLHNFSIDEQGMSQDVQPNSAQNVSVTFPDSGELSFYCKYHAASGMVGGLEVSGGAPGGTTDTGGTTGGNDDGGGPAGGYGY